MWKNMGEKDMEKAKAKELEKHTELKKYIGKEFNEEIKKQIETQFKPYTVTTCSLDRYYCEDFWIDQIRCALVEGKIAAITFG